MLTPEVCANKYMDNLKYCQWCNTKKPINDFYKKPDKNGSYYFQHHCKQCQNKYNFQKRNPQKEKQFQLNYENRKKLKILNSTGHNISRNQIQKYGLANMIDLYERDGAKCRKCGSDKRISVHHLDFNGYSKTDHPNNNPDNLILLCSTCHFKVHRGWTYNPIYLIQEAA